MLAKKLDPLMPMIYFLGMEILSSIGEIDEAENLVAEALEITPNFGYIYYAIGQIRLTQENFEAAIADFEKAVELNKFFPMGMAYLGYSYSKTGDIKNTEEILQNMILMKNERYVPSFSIAILYYALGDDDSFFRWCDKAYGERDNWIRYIDLSSHMDPYIRIRTDPRYKALLKKIGLSED